MAGKIKQMNRQTINYNVRGSHYAFLRLLYVSLWFCVGWLCYEQVVAACSVSLIGLRSAFHAQQHYVRKQKEAVTIQFEQMLYSISSSLQAGKSIENALLNAEKDLSILYAQQRTLMIQELERMNRQIKLGISVEVVIDELQRRLNINEITIWASTFSTCKRTGGDLVKVMKYSASMLVEKINLERELAILIAGKRFEAKLVTFIPFIFIAAFRYGSPEYMDPLYEGWGHWVMTGCLLAILFSRWLTMKMMQLEA
jgi:tight adherence protein B